MSFQAMTWAIEQKTGSPRAKCVLLSISNYANAEWCAYPKQELIAKESEQSTDSVQKYLLDLIDPGLVRRIKLKRYGRRTHDFLILRPSPLFDAPLEDIRQYLPSGCDVLEDAAASDGSVPDAEASISSADHQSGAAATGGSVEGTADLRTTLPPVAVDAADLRRQQEPVTNQESPTQSPSPPQEAAVKEASEKKREAEADLARFRANYPEPSNRPDEVAAAVCALAPEQRAALIRGAQGVAAARLANPKKAIVDQAKFVRLPALWAEYARLAPAVARLFVFTAAGTPADRAWSVYFRLIGWQVEPERLIEGQGGLLGRFWPGAEPKCGLGYGRFADVPLEQWGIYHADSPHYVAWGRRLKEWTGKYPSEEIILLDEMETITRPGGGTFEARKRIRGRRFPHPWPLNKAAAASPDAPIEAEAVPAGVSLMSAEDEDFIKQGGMR
jgi:hypothetical protein